jgi:hypothetical protein
MRVLFHNCVYRIGNDGEGAVLIYNKILLAVWRYCPREAEENQGTLYSHQPAL